MKSAHLFAGIGGGLLADMILGHDPVFALEIDPFCCERLRERQAEGWLPEAMEVINKDVKDFDPLPYAGKVDCLCGAEDCPRCYPHQRHMHRQEDEEIDEEEEEAEEELQECQHAEQAMDGSAAADVRSQQGADESKKATQADDAGIQSS